MGIIADIKLGFALTGLTSVHEELIVSRAQSPIGAGGGVDSLPRLRRLEIEEKYPKWLITLRKHPRHKVTHALLKNLNVARAIGSELRVQAISELLSILIEQGVALDIDTFSASYLD